jgi:hypothetical protein
MEAKTAQNSVELGWMASFRGMSALKSTGPPNLINFAHDPHR